MGKNNLKQQIDEVLSSEEIKNILLEIGKESNSVGRVSEAIGDIYTYIIVHRDNEGLTDYITSIIHKYRECNGDSKTMTYERSKALEKSIAKKLNLSINENGFNNKQENEIKQYFLKNYVEDGFVMHSFNGSAKQSIEENGFSSSKRVWSDEEVLDIASIFQKNGVLAPVGGYSHYSGKGLYVEYNPGMSFSHAVSGPEWFKWFTSSDHNDNSQKIDESPYYLKDYEACKQNVEDLCNNSSISEEDRNKVSLFFEKMWDKLGTGKTYTALIPKSLIGKNDISKFILDDESALQTIMTVLSDKHKEYEEHGGNCFEGKIEVKDVIILENPEAREIFGDRTYKRETREILYDKEKVEHLKNRIQRGRTILEEREKNPNKLNNSKKQRTGIVGYFKKIYERLKNINIKTLPSLQNEEMSAPSTQRGLEDELKGKLNPEIEMYEKYSEEKDKVSIDIKENEHKEIDE